MKLTQSVFGKINAELQEALTQTEREETLRVIMQLGSAESERASEKPENVFDPSQFSSRRDYRQALIDQQKAQVSQEVGDTLNKLRALSLKVQGGEIGRTVVVEGPAREITAALELPGVRSASLDQRFALIEPRVNEGKIETRLPSRLPTGQQRSIQQHTGQPVAFMSYTRFDDEYMGVAPTRLRDDLSRTVRFLSGREISIFQDVEGVKLGQNIQQRITASLNETLLLIPILTPSYFKSAWCRDELCSFLDRERQLGRNDLIISIYYQDVPALTEALKHPTIHESIHDPLIREIVPRMVSDWRPLQGLEWTAPAVQKELVRIAQRIITVVDDQQTSSESITGMAASKTLHEDQPAPGKKVAVDQQKLRDVMVQMFSSGELVLLYYDIQQELKAAGIEQQVNPEIVGGSGKAMQILNLIQFLDRRGYLSYLVAAVRRTRPGSI
jgi:hypothetical protein